MIVDCAVYEDGRRRHGQLPLEEAFEAGRNDDAFVWIGLHEPTEQEFDAVRREFGLHELAVEDAIKAHQRPKLEIYGDTLFVVLKPAVYDAESEEIELGETLLFVGGGFIVSVRHGEATALAEVRRAVEADPDRLRCGPDAVLHAIFDRVVDDYMPVAQSLEDDIEEVEADVFSLDRSNPAERIFKLKREVLEFSRATGPLSDPLDLLCEGDLPHIDGSMSSYFRDVRDHLTRVVEQVENHRELLTSILTANLTQVGVRQNEDMRKISAWVAIVAVPTMIAGVYGMNFEYMPELRWTFGYPLVVAIMVTVCTLLYRRFRRIGWM
ncbi:MAG: magnesium/cobalt transporter CorA [Thermoleophilaceae bacterium]|nr:magnesium/cobalt transporter CorA [Thermoleophilaceae bacterium]